METITKWRSVSVPQYFFQIPSFRLSLTIALRRLVVAMNEESYSYLIVVDTQVRNDERQGRRSKFRPLVQSQFERVHGRGADAQRGSYPLLKLEELMNADIKLYVECLVHKFKELQENFLLLILLFHQVS